MANEHEISGEYTGSSVSVKDSASGNKYTISEPTLTGNRTLTLPDANATLQSGTAITASSTETLTNKTFDANGTGNSLSNVDVADLANGTDGELITWDAVGAPATIATGSSGQVLTSNGAGAAPTFQAAAGGGDPTNSIVEATGQITTTSNTLIDATSMSITPAAGDYFVWFSAETDNTTPGNGVAIGISVDSTDDASSRRSWELNADAAAVTSMSISTMAKVTVNGAEAIKGRWSREGGGGTARMRERQLFIMKVA